MLWPVPRAKQRNASVRKTATRRRARVSRTFHHLAENRWRMVVVIHGDDDAVKTRELRHGSAELLESWLRQRLHIDLAGEQAREEQAAGAAEVLDLLLKGKSLIQ